MRQFLKASIDPLTYFVIFVILTLMLAFFAYEAGQIIARIVK